MSAAILAATAAIAWITERTTGRSNMITGWLGNINEYGPWCIATLAIASIVLYLASRNKSAAVAYCS